MKMKLLTVIVLSLFLVGSIWAVEEVYPVDWTKKPDMTAKDVQHWLKKMHLDKKYLRAQGGAPAQTYQVNQCGILASPGVYELNADLKGTIPTALEGYGQLATELPMAKNQNGFLEVYSCLTVIGNDITLDCKGFQLDGLQNPYNVPNNTYGILAIRNANVMVQNCKVINYSYNGYVYENNNTWLRQNQWINGRVYREGLLMIKRSRGVSLFQNQFGGKVGAGTIFEQSQVTSVEDVFSDLDGSGYYAMISVKYKPGVQPSASTQVYKTTILNNWRKRQTVISMLDVPNNAEADYSLRLWPGNIVPMNGYRSFANKGLAVYNVNGKTSVIEGLVFHWTEQELAGYDENKFELWEEKWPLPWTKIPGTLDTNANTLTLTNLQPGAWGSVYDLLQAP